MSSQSRKSKALKEAGSRETKLITINRHLSGRVIDVSHSTTTYTLYCAPYIAREYEVTKICVDDGKGSYSLCEFPGHIPVEDLHGRNVNYRCVADKQVVAGEKKFDRWNYTLDVIARNGHGQHLTRKIELDRPKRLSREFVATIGKKAGRKGKGEGTMAKNKKDYPKMGDIPEEDYD